MRCEYQSEAYTLLLWCLWLPTERERERDRDREEGREIAGRKEVKERWNRRRPRSKLEATIHSLTTFPASEKAVTSRQAPIVLDRSMLHDKGTTTSESYAFMKTVDSVVAMVCICLYQLLAEVPSNVCQAFLEAALKSLHSTVSILELAYTNDKTPVSEAA